LGRRLEVKKEPLINFAWLAGNFSTQETKLQIKNILKSSLNKNITIS